MMTIMNQKTLYKRTGRGRSFPRRVCVVTGRGMASRKATQGLEARYILGMRLGGNKEVCSGPLNLDTPLRRGSVQGRGRT